MQLSLNLSKNNLIKISSRKLATYSVLARIRRFHNRSFCGAP